MNRIILPLVAVAFVQLVNGQVPSQACVDATTALGTNAACTAAFGAGTDVTVLCMGTCRDLFNAIIDNCGAATAGTYSAVLDTLGCDGGNTDVCTAAAESVSADCATSLSNGEASVCSGTCATQLTAVVSACGSSTDTGAQNFISVYNTLCGSGAACTAATAAIFAQTTCQTDDSSVLCSGTCRALADTFISACPADSDAVIEARNDINRLCGSGNMLKASGVIILLIVAISALIF